MAPGQGHHARLRHRGRWFVFWTRVGDEPERILVWRLLADGDWRGWRFGESMEGGVLGARIVIVVSAALILLAGVWIW